MSTPADIPFQDLLDALHDVDNPFPARFLYRLSDLEETDLEKLKQAWPDIPNWRRRALMEDLETLGENDYLLSFETLARFAVQDVDARVREPAVRTLWEYESPDLIPVFIRLLENESDAEVRAAAATALGRFVYVGELEEIPAETLHDIEEHLLKAARNANNTLERRRALESLGYSSREEVSELIEEAFSTGNKDWMATALFAMGRSANEQWEPQVLKAIDSQLPALRSEAARAAGELELSAALPSLLELLEDPDENVRLASIWSLSQIGGEGVSEALESLYEETEDEEEAEYIETAMENLAFTEGMQPFKLFDFPEDVEVEEDEVADLQDLEDELFESFEDDEDSVV